ncbi:MAG: GAF domain-containing protein [Clostridiaceae bacterium]|nr:GAF domain-containing protein [Clostridiaceae bacterium]
MTDKEKNYREMCIQLKGIIEDEPDALANLSNSAALLWSCMKNINWSGFYLLKNGQLVLGPFQGKPACVRINMGKGVCGTSAEKRESIVVQDVHLFPGHIACDEASASEVVIPIIRAGRLMGVLDIDSPFKERFDAEDRKGLEAFTEILSAAVCFESLIY